MIDNQGKFEIPLYHGTSSLFLNSIIDHGLGGQRDPRLFDVNILTLLAQALDAPANKTEWWELNSLIVEPMLNQRITGGNYNFRYGGTYLTPSKLTACRYATYNHLGSEFLSTIYLAFMALNSVNPKEAIRIIPEDHCLRVLFKKTYTPILITVTNIEANNLRTEQGQPIDEQVSTMIKLKNDTDTNDLEILFQQFNFEFKGIIQSDLLNIAYLDKKMNY